MSIHCYLRLSFRDIVLIPTIVIGLAGPSGEPYIEFLWAILAFGAQVEFAA